MATQWRQRRSLITISSLMVVISSLLLAMPPPVLSFGTVDAPFLLNQSTEHERITRAALACPPGTKPSGDCFEPHSLTQIAGTTLTLGAVGAPDAWPFWVDPPPAHCDDADFLDNASYPISRGDATFALQLCIAHLQLRFEQGKAAAERLIDSRGRIRRLHVDLTSDGDCVFTPSRLGRAKCNVFDSFGRTLHGIQDFYSHSNWMDSAEPPFTPEHPPGLGLSAPASIFDLRNPSSSSSFDVPYNLSTGCYAGRGSDTTPGSERCLGRVTHHTLNKDTGTIDPVTGAASAPTTQRGRIGANFENAVRGAIIETRRQWRDFRAELEIQYGPKRAGLMICALTRDDPMKSCQGRKIAIVIDSSGSNTDTDPFNLRVAAARAFNSMLVTAADAGSEVPPDRVTVIDFDGSARVIYPLGDPSGATFDIDSSGDTFIAGGIAVAIAELTKEPEDVTADRTGIVVLTDGQDDNVELLVLQVLQAWFLGIRVSFGFLSPPDNPVPRKRSALLRREPPLELVTAILRTGGFFSDISSAETQRAFIDLVITHGPTNLDNAKGSNDGGPLSPGLTISALASAASGPDTFTYHALPGEQLTFTIKSMSGQLLKVVVRNVRESVVVKECTTDAAGKAVISFTVTKEADLEVIVSTTDANEGVYSVGLKMTPKCDRCPCVGRPPCSTTEIISSITLSYVTTFCIGTPTVIKSISSSRPSLTITTLPLITTTPPLPPSLILTSSPRSPSSPSSPSSPGSPSSPRSPSSPGSPSSPRSPTSISPTSPINPTSLLCSTTTIIKPTTTVRQVTICPSSSWPTISSTYRPLSSSTTKTHSSTSFKHNVKLASGTLHGTLAPGLDADTKENKSFGVYVALICIVAVQSAIILGGLIWWGCFGRERRGSYSTLQGGRDGQMKFVPEWMASWTPSRYGYSKPGDDNAPPGVVTTEPETKDTP